jgi:DNA/RNA-binding protein KIN17
MPKAEVGSTRHLANKLKSKGLQRLRWYCQVCEKQCRDANGFKMHTQSESHVRQMLIVGEDPKKFINEYSNQFVSDFLQLLKTGHGEKQVLINQFYQEYIANKVRGMPTYLQVN